MKKLFFSFKVLKISNIISFIDKPFYHYVNYPNSQSKKGNDDPWGDVCNKIEHHLTENHLLEQYKSTLNSFRFTALVVSIYRKTQNYKFIEALNQSKKGLSIFRKTYGFELDKDSLENRVRYLIPLAKMNFVVAFVVIAKIKSIFKQ
ncbi:hypothetical protein [Cohnella kolymensis]|uniref:hypothetical protein n=1 Tax=Cohnella kolymensis TaxID=1590652 RepID=UPI001269C6A8|nr:hypothetical protein [Cohnella kolymensis]